MVLVPGLTIPLFYWDRFAEQLHARGLRTLAFSAYGRGYSDRLAADYNEALFRRQLYDLVTALDLPPDQHIVGTSMGALIALGHVAEHPDSSSTLTVVGPAGIGASNARQQRLLRSDRRATFAARRFGRRMLLGHLGHNVADPALAAPLTAMIADAYRFEGSMYGFFSTLQNFPLSGREALFRRVAELDVPTLLLWGSADRVTPITGLGTVRNLLHPDEVHILDCGHMAPYERPAEVAAHVTTFLSAHPDRSTR
ncbi:alpha/beta fold hydrolase [Mycolicibacterium xanthum]|uniref:alpha/beta fold hydrolase n=1 Tax=Mycolicibacterium xanthum TaxID=2796469 RepID=UPI0027E16874|nr:alpha/beta hydrolase [Mycolicibacterium xanthum]